MDGNRAAAFNMAADEAILRACADGVVRPTLRLYSWQRPAISVGLFQSIERSRIDIQYCHDAGIELVRRPTGGRAVLHGHDLTFSIALHECRIPNSFKKVLASHMWLMGGIA
ncbi:MAG TPA: lipoate--protein ligase family protein, partial [Armatimonadota bacterium]|nr:lipoate--protein ligase family protein [Armatimonadota bacterium]